MTEFNKSDIENDPLVQEFFNSRPISEGTKKNYLYRFIKYSNFTGMSLSELIDEAEEEEKNQIRTRYRKIKKYLNEFARYLDDVEYAPGKKYSEITIGRNITDIKTFYHYFDIVTPKINLKPENPPRRDDLPTMDEIKKALRNISTRDKALVLLHLSSGMGGAEVKDLKTETFLKGLELPENTPLDELRSKLPEHPICTLWIMRIKENVEYVTFCSPECVYAIVDYLEEKGSYSEYLFPNTQGEKMSEQSHMGIFKRINDKLGFGFTANGKRRRFTSHKLRAVFSTNMYAEGVDWTKIDQMLGHTPNKITRAYRRPSEDVYKEAYIDGLDSITTDKINIIDYRSPEVQALRDENIELREELKSQKEDQQAEIARLKLELESSVEKMNKKVDDLNWIQKLTPDGLKPMNEEELKKSIEYQDSLVKEMLSKEDK
jgi:integrase